MAARRGPATWLPWAALGLVVVVALAIGSGAVEGRTLDDRVHAISLTIKCPQCHGQSVATSEATTAVTIRKDIEARLRRGQSADEIRDYYGSHYGEDILLNPSSSGSARVVWVLPVLAIIAAFGGLAIAFRRWRVAEVSPVSEADRELVEAAMADQHGEGDGR